MKKGIVFLWLSLFFAFLTVILLLLFYVLFVRGEMKTVEIGLQQSFTSTANNALISYLNAPMPGTTVTFADQIKYEWDTGRNFHGPLKTATQQFLQSIEFPYYDVIEREQRIAMFILAIYEPPGTRATELLCVSSVSTTLNCVDPSEVEQKAVAYVPVTRQRSNLYVTMLPSHRSP